MPYKSISAVVATSNNVAAPVTLTPVLPTRATGDLLVAITSSRSITATVATPAGWTIWPGFPKRSTTASGGSFYVFYKEVVGGEANPGLTWTGHTGGTTGDSCQACVVCLSDADNTTPSDSTPPAATDASAAGPSIPTLTTATAGALVLGIAMKVNDVATTGTVANSFTERGDFHTTSGTGHQLYVATRDMGAAGATGASAITEAPTTVARCLAVALAVKAAPPPVPLSEVVLDDFNRANAKVEVGAGASVWVGEHMAGGGTSDLRVISNQLGNGTAGPMSAYTKVALDNADGNCDVIFDVPALDSNGGFQVYYLLTNPAQTPNIYNAYLAYYGSGSYQLMRYANGTYVNAFGTASGTCAAGDSIWIRKRGSSHKVYRKPSGGQWGMVVDATDANHNPAAGVVAVNFPDQTGRLDNLRGGPWSFPVTNFPVTGVLDDFNRADESPISGGGAWATPTFNDRIVQVLGNQAKREAPIDATWCSAHRLTPYAADQETHLTWATKGTGSVGVELLLRVQNPNLANCNAYLLTVGSTGTWTMWSYLSRNQVQIGAVGASPAITDGDGIGFRIDGVTLTAYHRRGGNWYLVMTRSDSVVADGGFVGLTIQDPSTRIDDFSGGGLVAAGPTYETTIDDFNRADGVLTGPVWTSQKVAYAGVAALWSKGNQLAADIAYAQALSAVTLESDFDLLWDCAVSSGDLTAYFCVAGAGASTWNGYYLTISGAFWTLYERPVAGGATQLFSLNKGALVAGDSIWIERRGAALTVYRKPSGGAWAVIGTVTNSTFMRAGPFGFELSNTTQRFDNLRGGPLVGPKAYPRTASDSWTVTDTATRPLKPPVIAVAPASLTFNYEVPA